MFHPDPWNWGTVADHQDNSNCAKMLPVISIAPIPSAKAFAIDISKEVLESCEK
jgi:hypothetical protein